MLDKVKLALRLTTASFDDELDVLIESCKADLRKSGIALADVEADAEVSDPQVLQAVILYCKAHFGYEDNPTAERFLQAYEHIKIALLLTGGETDAVS